MTDEDGNTVYTGDAPSCLVDQKNAVRFVKYNILLGNLPGSVDYFVSTGGSGGGAHAVMLAATSDHPDYYDYEIEAGAVGVYRAEDGSYITSVTIDGAEVPLSDGMWGCMAYEADIAQIQAGDSYGNNIVSLYDPIRYIGGDETHDPTWARLLLGASEGDISMFNSLNLQLAWLAAGTDAQIEWQWDGGHVPSEILGDSFALYVDAMYGMYVEGAVKITKAEATQTAGGSAASPTGTDLTGWVSYDPQAGVSFSLADAAAYRVAAASKAIPGFDVMDYGQEDLVFGSSSQDARHWSAYVLQAFEEHAAELDALF